MFKHRKLTRVKTDELKRNCTNKAKYDEGKRKFITNKYTNEALLLIL